MLLRTWSRAAQDHHLLLSPPHPAQPSPWHEIMLRKVFILVYGNFPRIFLYTSFGQICLIYQHSYAVKCFWTTCDKQRNQEQSLIFKVSSVNILCQNQQYLKGWCYQKIELSSPWASSSLVSIKPSPLFSLWHLLPHASTWFLGFSEVFRFWGCWDDDAKLAANTIFSSVPFLPFLPFFSSW